MISCTREFISDLTNLCNGRETRDTHLALAPFDDKYVSPVDWTQMGQNEAIAGPHFPNDPFSYVPHAALLKLWQQCHFYDPYFRVGTDATKPTVELLGCCDHHWGPPGAFTHTHTHTHNCLLWFTLAHSHRLWTSGFMVCEQQFFFFFFNAGLRQTVFGANWSLCCILSHFLEHIYLPATLAGRWKKSGPEPRNTKEVDTQRYRKCEEEESFCFFDVLTNANRFFLISFFFF